MTSAPRMLRRLRRVIHLTSHYRGASSDRSLATVLAAVAGCANAGGFLAFGHYASHMTGYLSQVADSPAMRDVMLGLQGIAAIVFFIGGAATSAILINWSRLHMPRQQYSLPVAVQGGLFIVFAGLGGLGSVFPIAGNLALGLLFFIMGLQNATITKLSGARIRTTHATGMVTDVGIELGREAFGRLSHEPGVRADRPKLRVLVQLLVAFVLGGITGGFGYGALGFVFALPLSLILLWISLPRLLRAGRSKPA